MKYRGKDRMWRFNNVDCGINTHAVSVQCGGCGQRYQFWLNQNRGMKDPIFSIDQAEMSQEQPCPDCGVHNALGGLVPPRQYNIFEN
jgi:hypothetical protein